MEQIDMCKLVQHLVVQEDGTLPLIPDCLYAYVLAGNGIFLYAKRENLEVLIPNARTLVGGLPPLEPFIHTPRVPAVLLQHTLNDSQKNLPSEILFWFNFDHERQAWKVDTPLQICRHASVFPLDRNDPLGTRALIDLHSHALLHSFFSHADNRDEQGFRLFAVIGRVNDHPEILVRVGVYGNYWNIPANMVFDLPEEIRDAYYGKGCLEYEETISKEEVVGRIGIFDETTGAE